MENIQEELKKQYNMSIGFYNKGDYEHYFFHTRYLLLVDYQYYTL